MALKTDYKDDILATGNLRKYQMIQNNDGTVSFQDVTQYAQTGDIFGAGDINKTNQAVNEKFDSGDVVDPMLTTEPGFAADAYRTKLQFDEQNKNIETLGESVSNGKTLVANAITAKGVSTSTSASFSTMADNIRAIPSIKGATVGQGNANYNITGLVSGKTYILNMACLGNSEDTTLGNGANIIQRMVSSSTDKFSGYYTRIIAILFTATSSTAEIKNLVSYKWFSYSLIEM